MAEKKKGKGGRKPKYAAWMTEQGLTLVKDWARNGLNDKEIAQNMGIAMSTFYDWGKKFPEFSEALSHTRAYTDANVENAFYKCCVGYTYTQQEPIKVKRSKWCEEAQKILTYEEVVIVDVEKYMPPSDRAAFNWEKCRRSDRFKERPDEKPTQIIYQSHVPAEDPLPEQ